MELLLGVVKDAAGKDGHNPLGKHRPALTSFAQMRSPEGCMRHNSVPSIGHRRHNFSEGGNQVAAKASLFLGWGRRWRVGLLHSEGSGSITRSNVATRLPIARAGWKWPRK
eukprot:1161383-Pelagomonas_calceolata.AAC.5